MTPEERWIKIENAIQALLASQGQHEAELSESRVQIAENAKQIAENGKQIADNAKQIARISQETEKNTAAIKDLIVVSRTVVDAQRATETQLQRLIDTVNALLKGFQKPNGNQ